MGTPKLDLAVNVSLALNVFWALAMLQAWMITGSGRCLAAFVISSAVSLWIAEERTLDEYRRRLRTR